MSESTISTNDQQKNGNSLASIDSVILEEEIDPNYVPSEEEVLEYSKWLGMDLNVDSDLYWIAREGLMAPLPKDWKPCKTKDTEDIYYFNFTTGESTWDHPCDGYYRRLYEEEKKKKELSLKEKNDQKRNKAKQDVELLLGKTTEKKKKNTSPVKSNSNTTSAYPIESNYKPINTFEKKPLPSISTNDDSRSVSSSTSSVKSNMPTSSKVSSKLLGAFEYSESRETVDNKYMERRNEISNDIIPIQNYDRRSEQKAVITDKIKSLDKNRDTTQTAESKPSNYKSESINRKIEEFKPSSHIATDSNKSNNFKLIESDLKNSHTLITEYKLKIEDLNNEKTNLQMLLERSKINLAESKKMLEELDHSTYQKINELRTLNTNFKNENEELKDSIHKIKFQLQRLEDEFDKLKLVESNLKVEILSLTAKSKDYEDLYNRTKDSLKNCKEENIQLTNDIKSTDIEILNLKGTIETLQNEVTAVNKSNAILRFQLEADDKDEENMANMKKDYELLLNSKDEVISTLKSEIKELSSKFSNIEIEYSNTKKDLIAANNILSNIKYSSTDSIEVDKIKLLNIESELVNSQNLYNNLLCDYKILQNNLADTETRLMLTKELNDSSKDKYVERNLQSKNTSETDINIVNNQYPIEDLTAIINDRDMLIDKIKQENRSLYEQITSFQRRLDTLESDNTELKKKLLEYNELKFSNQNKIDSHANESIAYNKTIYELKLNLEKLNNLNVMQIEKNQNLEDKLKNFTSENAVVIEDCERIKTFQKKQEIELLSNINLYKLELINKDEQIKSLMNNPKSKYQNEKSDHDFINCQNELLQTKIALQNTIAERDSSLNKLENCETLLEEIKIQLKQSKESYDTLLQIMNDNLECVRMLQSENKILNDDISKKDSEINELAISNKLLNNRIMENVNNIDDSSNYSKVINHFDQQLKQKDELILKLKKQSTELENNKKFFSSDAIKSFETQIEYLQNSLTESNNSINSLSNLLASEQNNSTDKDVQIIDLQKEIRALRDTNEQLKLSLALKENVITNKSDNIKTNQAIPISQFTTSTNMNTLISSFDANRNDIVRSSSDFTFVELGLLLGKQQAAVDLINEKLTKTEHAVTTILSSNNSELPFSTSVKENKIYEPNKLDDLESIDIIDNKIYSKNDFDEDFISHYLSRINQSRKLNDSKNPAFSKRNVKHSFIDTKLFEERNFLHSVKASLKLERKNLKEKQEALIQLKENYNNSVQQEGFQISSKYLNKKTLELNKSLSDFRKFQEWVKLREMKLNNLESLLKYINSNISTDPKISFEPFLALTNELNEYMSSFGIESSSISYESDSEPRRTKHKLSSKKIQPKIYSYRNDNAKINSNDIIQHFHHDVDHDVQRPNSIIYYNNNTLTDKRNSITLKRELQDITNQQISHMLIYDQHSNWLNSLNNELNSYLAIKRNTSSDLNANYNL